MGLRKIIQVKWLDRVKQYGLTAAFKQLWKAVLRPIYLKNEDVVVAVINHKPTNYEAAEVFPLTPETIEGRKEQWGLTADRLADLHAPLSYGCRGFMIERNGQLAAYAFVQYSGGYTFGKSGKFLIPEGMAVLKNLYVFSEYRGGSLGKDLNRKRLTAIPEGTIPLGFVISENRYALRNLMMYGFVPLIKVTRVTWFGRVVRQKISIMKNNPISQRVVAGLQ